jgi:transcriptional regulator with XRE-family HTH domain
MNYHQSLTLLGLNVRRIREESGLTQEALAERCELDSTYISGIERGVRNPSLLSLTRLAKGLSTTVAVLCEGVEQ